MTEIPYYKCDVCGEVYNQKKSAENCEKSHVNPVSVRASFLRDRRNSDNEFYGKPKIVIVKMSNDEEYEYVYKGPVGNKERG